MTMGLEARASVAQLLASEGRALTIRTKSGTYDAETGDVSSNSPTTFTGRGRIGDYRDRQIDGTLILQGDRLCTFQPDNWANIPTNGLEVLDGSTVYTIINTKKRELDDIICYTFQLRGV